MLTTVFVPEICTELPDVTLIIDNAEFPTHRSILSEKSEYFMAMFSSSFIETHSDRIELKETNLKAFNCVLEYMYTGKMDYLNDVSTPLNEIFDVLTCARFFMIDAMIKDVVSCLQRKETIICGTLLSTAIAYSEDGVILHCENLFKDNPSLLNKAIIQQLSPQAMETVLNLSLNTAESNVFEALVDWMRLNPDQPQLFPKFLSHIDLYLLDQKHFDTLFEPMELVNQGFFQDLLRQQREAVQKVENQNVVNDLRIVDGVKKFDYSKPWAKEYLIFSYSKDYVIIDLKQLFLLNCIKFRIQKKAHYTISVSSDMRGWTCIVDYSRYECFSQQELHFDDHVIRFIRVHVKPGVKITAIKALYSTEHFEFDPARKINVPMQNMISTKTPNKYTYGITGKLTSGKIIDGHVTHRIRESYRRIHENPYVFYTDKHKKNRKIVYRFSQPQLIGSMKLLLEKTFTYSIKISIDGYNWREVFLELNVNGWRTVTFERRPVMFIKIRGYSSSSEYFKLLKFKCPAV